MPTARPLLAILLAAVTLAAGCLAPGGEDGAAPASSDDSGAARATPPVVVAVIDNGITPYHAAFRAWDGGPSFADVPGFPADAARIPLTLDAGGFEAALEADEAAWSAIPQETLVVFEGTRVAGAWFAKPDEASLPIVGDGGHGTPVADAVLEASPHALVVMLQIYDDEDIVPAMLWAAKQPWIDVVSVSWGKYVPEYVEEPDMGLADAYREAARAGKILVNSAGNEPTLHWTDEHNGPPFVIAVGGARNESNGETSTTSRFPDVVADYVQTLAVAHSMDEDRDIAGTSFSCPTVAGTLAEALWLVRDAVGATTGGTTPEGALASAKGGGALEDGALTADEVRHGMAHRAETWDATEWSPAPFSNPILLPAAQMGWGFVAPAHAPDIAEFLLGELDLPEKPPETVAFMQARAEARRAAWGDA